MKNGIRTTVVSLALSALSASAFAAAAPTAASSCVNEAVRGAVKANFKSFGASTNSCGAKLLASGPEAQTFLVCVSDESDPSEWVVSVETTDGRRAGICKVASAVAQNTEDTPNFADETGVIASVSCTADIATQKGAVICK